MITRAHIRRQLRASGGITNAINGSIGGGIIQGNPMGTRTGYGNPFKIIKKGLSKVVDVAKQVVKSPIGKAALIGLGGAGLMGMGPLSGLGGIGARIGGGLSGLKTGLGATLLGTAGGTSRMTPGILGKLGLTGGGGSMGITGLGKLLGAGGLIGYFTSKGASEEEAKELAQDVYRGEGIGFDQIRADLNKYKSGELSQKQMFDKNYRFLTPRNFVAAKGGRVGLRSGGDPLPEDPTKPINPFGPKPTGPVLPNKMAEIPKSMTLDEAIRSFDLAKPELSKKLKGTKKYLPAVIKFFKNRKLSAMGGIMDMPMGNMRRNRAGVMERDYRDKGGFVPVGVKEKADDVPAMLSKNEFVMTADAVRGAGDGNIKKGAQRMYDLMKRNEGKVA